MLHFIKGNLFDVQADILINTINLQGVMGKGIALEFKNRYPEMFNEYRIKCKNGDLHIGHLFVWDSPDGKKIINFPTKNHWRYNSKYEYIDSGLDALRDYFVSLSEYGNFKAVIPPLGCGNGGLNWNMVSKKIVDKLNDIDAEIFVVEPI